MKKTNKKGFTIVELVIVIAVIAILAAVLIPTFSGIVEKAQKSSALQEARNYYTELYADDIQDGVIDGAINGTDITLDTGVTYTTASGEVTKFEYTAENDKTVTFANGAWTVK